MTCRGKKKKKKSRENKWINLGEKRKSTETWKGNDALDALDFPHGLSKENINDKLSWFI